MLQDIHQGSLELLYNISRELATTLDLHTILSRVLFLSSKNLGADRGTLIVLDENLKPMDAALIYGGQLNSHALEQISDTTEKGLAGWVIRSRMPALINNTREDERWLRHPDDAVEASGAKSAICVPLIARDRLVGILTIVHPKPGFFDQNHLNLLQSIADQAGIAVYNALLYESLQTANKNFRELFEDSIDPILITDLEGKMLIANHQAARLFNYAEDELLQYTIFELHEAHLGASDTDLEVIMDNQTISYESVLHSVNSGAIPIEVYVRRINFAGKGSLQWLIRDISERKILEKLRKDLSAMIYHDLRSPLSNIITSLDMAETLITEDKDPTLRTILSIVDRSAERVQRLVSSLLDIDRLEAGQPITDKKSANIKDLIRDAMDIVHPTIETRHLIVTTNVPEDFPSLWMDEDMIKRVLINLLENAVKYVPEKGSLIVGGKVDGNWAVMWVEDNGPGIPVEAREKVFDKFTRLKSSSKQKGFGLGLAFCRLAVEAHGGKIWVESPGTVESANPGSRFIFKIPLVEHK